MINTRHVAAVVVAAGGSARMGFDKLFYKIEGEEVLLKAIKAMHNHMYVDELIIVAGENKADVEQLCRQGGLDKPSKVVTGGATRTQSVLAGLAACPHADIVAIHDGARPFVTADIIGEAIEQAAETGAAAPAVAVKDTIKVQQGGVVVDTPQRSSLAAVQTPQVFDRALFLQAMDTIPEEQRLLLTDDCMVMEYAGKPVYLTQGSYENRKITTPDDLDDLKEKGESTKMQAIRIGHGYDVHKLVKERPLILGGETVPYEKGLLGHSDADVLAHAVTDALLGALALGDIGKLFPDNDPANKDVNSMLLLQKVVALVHKKGYTVGNIDATILCQAPKLAPFITKMRHNLAATLQMELDAVSVKATTEEKLGFTGKGEGIAAHTVALLYSNK